jgi:hypothetical protein
MSIARTRPLRFPTSSNARNEEVWALREALSAWRVRLLVRGSLRGGQDHAYCQARHNEGWVEQYSADAAHVLRGYGFDAREHDCPGCYCPRVPTNFQGRVVYVASGCDCGA